MMNRQILQANKFCRPPEEGTQIKYNGHIYTIGKVIGQGNFGCVYECRDEWENELVAKIILPKNRTYEEVKKEWLEELQKLVILRHKNITYIHSAFECNNTFYLIIERCYCTLNHLLNMPNIRNELWLPSIAKDILQGIDFIHDAGYVHKDIHPGNIFVSRQDKIISGKEFIWSFKIGDFGISRLESDINIFNTVLANWMLPPEFLNPYEFGLIGKQVDIYHTGLLLLSLILGCIPEFTQEEILAGKPRQLAENNPSPYGYTIAKALRRHIEYRTPTALDFWRDISQVRE